MTTTPPYPPTGAGTMVKPHRGGLILAFGILSLLLCVIFGIVAWVMSNGDLKAMAEGRMDPSGEGLTKAGKILSIISVVLNIVAAVIGCIVVVLAVVAGAAAAASQGGGAGP